MANGIWYPGANPCAGQTYYGGSSLYVLGTAFKITASDKVVTHVCYLKNVAETNTATGRIWEITGASTGTLLASVEYTDGTTSGWRTQALDTPLALDTAKLYLVTVEAVGLGIAYNTSAHGSEIVNGDVTSPATADVPGGQFKDQSSGSGGYPNSGGIPGWAAGVDVIVDDAGGGDPPPTYVSSALSAKCLARIVG